MLKRTTLVKTWQKFVTSPQRFVKTGKTQEGPSPTPHLDSDKKNWDIHPPYAQEKTGKETEVDLVPKPAPPKPNIELVE